MSVLVVGSVALDDIETPLERRSGVVGGSATFAAAAASLFSPVRLVGVVGQDFPNSCLEFLEGRCVDLAGLERVQDGATFRWAGRYLEDFHGRETLDTQLNVFEHFSPNIPVPWRDTPFVFLGNIHPALQLRVLDQISAPRFVACDTMNFWIDGAREDLDKVISRVDLVIVNDEEAVDLTGKHNLTAAGRLLCERGPRAVIVKLGARGALYVTAQSCFLAPAHPDPKLRDPTGAGDSFAGALMGAVARTEDLSEASMRRAVVMGCVAASFAIEGFGPETFAGVEKPDLRRRYEELHAYASFDTELDALL